MKRFFCILIAASLCLACGKEKNPAGEQTFERPAYAAGQKQGNITYQLLIYSFADSDGDGIGDFNGIKSKLDYLDALGVSAIWLSPAHPADSYHGYDVQDYSAVNPKYGTEADFKALIDAAHAKGSGSPRPKKGPRPTSSAGSTSPPILPRTSPQASSPCSVPTIPANGTT